MTELLVFIYGVLAVFVIHAIQRDQRLQRPSSQMVTMVGWGLLSLSSTLALLMVGLAVALALGFNPPIEGLAGPAF